MNNAVKVLTLGIGLLGGVTISHAAPNPGQHQPTNPAQTSSLKNAPGYNIHIVEHSPGKLVLRGGAPTKGTMDWLNRVAKENNLPLTVVDLRTPARPYDLNKEGGRLTPTEEKSHLLALGHQYAPMSALGKTFGHDLNNIVGKEGIVYIHCQYGVNRTGFAIGRLSKLTGKQFDRTGLGDRDFKQGVNYQK